MNNVHFAIPEIYGETLSYYELLRKLVNKTNDLIENYNTVPEQIAEEVKNLDASKLFSAVLNQLIHSIATDNTKSANAVKVYKKHDLLYAAFNDTVNLYESLIDFTTGTETELIPGTNIREVNISELLIELRKLIENEAQAREQGDNALQTNIDNEAQAREHADNALQTNIDNEAQSREQADQGLQTNIENEISTLRTMLSTPYNFKGEVSSISALPASGEVNDTYYVQDVKYKVTWTGSAWVQSSLSEADYQTELSELKSDVDEITNVLPKTMVDIDVSLISITNLKRWGSDADSLIDFQYGRAMEMACKENQKFDFCARLVGSTDATLRINFLDKNNTLLSSLTGQIQTVGEDGYPYHTIFTTPSGCRKIRWTEYNDEETENYVKSYKVESISSTSKGEMPSYYDSYISQKIAEVNQNTEVLNGVSFVFLTDMHFTDNSLNSKYLVKNILDNTNIPFAICGGDYVQAYGTKEECLKNISILNDYFKHIGKDRFFCLRGNHDFTIKTTDTTGYTAPLEKTYNAIVRNSEFYVSSIQSGKFHYYIDIPAQKTRFFILNSCDHQRGESDYWGVDVAITQDQIDWLIENMTNVENYRFVFIGHVPIDSAMHSYVPTQKVLHQIFSALKNKTSCVIDTDSTGIVGTYDFSQSTNEAICFICGHNHRDLNTNTDGLLSISTTSDAHYGDDGYGRPSKVGTVEEQAIDIFTIDFDSRTIKTVRVGGGSNRSFSY